MLEQAICGPKLGIPLTQPIFTKEMEKAVVDSLWNEKFVAGETVYKFEEEFAKYCDVDYVVSTNSGTDALQIALKAVGVGDGHYVITSPASFIASSNAVLGEEWKPDFGSPFETHYESFCRNQPTVFRQSMFRTIWKQ